MALAIGIRTSVPGLKDRFDAVLRAYDDYRAKRKVFTRTRNELRALSSRELADVGIHPTQITSIAYEAAYGTN